MRNIVILHVIDPSCHDSVAIWAFVGFAMQYPPGFFLGREYNLGMTCLGFLAECYFDILRWYSTNDVWSPS